MGHFLCVCFIVFVLVNVTPACAVNMHELNKNVEYLNHYSEQDRNYQMNNLPAVNKMLESALSQINTPLQIIRCMV